MWVFGNWRNSRGVCREILECEKIHLPYKILSDCGDNCSHCPLAGFDDGGIYCSLGENT